MAALDQGTERGGPAGQRLDERTARFVPGLRMLVLGIATLAAGAALTTPAVILAAELSCPAPKAIATAARPTTATATATTGGLESTRAGRCSWTWRGPNAPGSFGSWATVLRRATLM